jgi:flagellar biosynthesis protein FlhG
MTPPPPSTADSPARPTLHSSHHPTHHHASLTTPAQPTPPTPLDQAARLRALVEAARGPSSHRAPTPPSSTPASPNLPAREPRSSLTTPASLPRLAPSSIPAASSPRASAAPSLTTDSPSLRTHLAPPSPLIAITSGKGGVGKTSLAVNLAIALTALNLRVTLVDADLGLANADVLLGIPATTRLDAAVEWSPGTRPRPLASLAIDAPGNFRLVPGASGQARMATLSPSQRAALNLALVDLARTCDIVLIDTGAGLSAGVTSVLEAADLTLVVATPEPTSITDAYAVLKCVGPTLRARPQPSRFGVPFMLLANQVKDHSEADALARRIDATSRRFLGQQVPCLGLVRFDPAVPKAVRRRAPLMLESATAPAARDVTALAASLARAIHIMPEPAPRRRPTLARFLGLSS